MFKYARMAEAAHFEYKPNLTKELPMLQEATALAFAAPTEISGTIADRARPLATMEESLEFNPALPFMVVTHHNPDTDAIACIWFVDRFLSADGKETKIRYVRAGERLPISEGTGFNVIHADTGFGKFDQHEKNLQGASSFQLLVEHFGYADDPGIKPILVLTQVTDNAKPVDDCSVHNVFKALAGIYKLEGTKDTDWDAVVCHAMTDLDALCSFHRIRAEGREIFKERGKMEELANGLKLGVLMFESRLMNGAYHAGADAVVWMQRQKGTKGFYVGIQVKDGSPVKLGDVVVALRWAEAKRRNLSIPACEVVRMGTLKELPMWFIHDSNKLILSGSRSHPLSEGDYTLLGVNEIVRIVRTALEKK